MDFTIKGVNSTPSITKNIAGVTYDLIKQFGNADLALKGQTGSLIEPSHFKIVDDEADDITVLANKFMSGGYLLEAAVIDEEGEITTPAVYYEPSTKADLVSQIESDILDVETVVDDLIGSLTWIQFKASFNNEE